ncbi:hypothetical protein MSR1_27700 [Magnetospirillum gryphiswaldense MSR-1]|nr:hypothetical protein MSR1_27700 [Magnetospirillum gryphiswaldense MSR-1]AVM79143.1 hypothetical protein MSR1L_27700 [Magnetospirillum gryphiswaldense]
MVKHAAHPGGIILGGVVEPIGDRILHITVAVGAKRLQQRQGRGGIGPQRADMGAPDAARSGRFAGEAAQIGAGFRRPRAQQVEGGQRLGHHMRAQGQPGPFPHAEMPIVGQRTDQLQPLGQGQIVEGSDGIGGPAAHGIGRVGGQIPPYGQDQPSGHIHALGDAVAGHGAQRLGAHPWRDIFQQHRQIHGQRFRQGPGLFPPCVQRRQQVRPDGSAAGGALTRRHGPAPARRCRGGRNPAASPAHPPPYRPVPVPA